jgi:Ca2+/Na+ antiporter
MMGACFYEERVSSGKTEALFVVLALLFLLLFVWRAMATGLGLLAIVFLLLFGLFLFYSLNYRTLTITMTSESLELGFGVFRWTVPWHTIEECDLDDTPMWRIAGAGIHCTWIRRRYRVFLNFLEYPRVVLALRERKGPVRDIAFSTRRPEEVVRAITQRIGQG